MTHEECVESFTAEKYILGELSNEQNGSFEEHYFDCSECAEAVRRLSQLHLGVKSGWCEETHTAAEPESRSSLFGKLWDWWLRPQASLASFAAAACVAAGALGLQNWQMRERLRPQTVQTVVLPPATRGEPPILQTQSAGAFVLLEADLPSATGNVNWVVRSADNKNEFEGSASAPEPGLSFRLLLPAPQISSGDHTLVVRSSEGREWLFRFRAGPH